MSRRSKRPKAQRTGCPIADLRAMRPDDKDRPALAAKVVGMMRSGVYGHEDGVPVLLTQAQRIAASDALTPADWRASQPSADAAERWTDGQPNTVTSRPTICREALTVKRAATLDNRGWVWNAEVVRLHLAEAMDTMRRMRFPANEVPSTKVAACIEFARTRAELEALMLDWLGDVKALVAAPTPKELRSLDETLPWLYAVTDWRHRIVASLRASGMSWRSVAAKVNHEIARRTGGEGISYETARRWEEKAVDQIVKALNSKRHAAA
ncbi:hypothetical protein D9623_33715 (plasmid) [Azospirillum brasilense]|uniref:Uncharacterized protein n=1 Tax=Azospirillum brasilense TaxID=192 RepID=Q6QW53_AZOBR|nr:MULTISPECIES: hypothetical protein [Azospirillum]YP_001686862.1 hypothetical protein APCd_gp21 [Azospirillum phage Cd]AAS83067.1 hypothetical protein pRhico079 [Azospirillum brasilense]MDW7555400.1 hypothetical protein [Azospirillum brasilense]MDW7595192.1 hypothetical protein [Azospirillum brasilense]MDW7630345.1 hypothetical protein [Azospirillum brasilense]MDX5949713.1 hypothetical protein [Azospirillum brasilense]